VKSEIFFLECSAFFLTFFRERIQKRLQDIQVEQNQRKEKVLSFFPDILFCSLLPPEDYRVSRENSKSTTARKSTRELTKIKDNIILL
jgi:hypothetical protein